MTEQAPASPHGASARLRSGRRTGATRTAPAQVDPDPADARPTPVGPRTLLGGRYRLLRLHRSGPLSGLWRAEDEILARPVAVRVLAAGSARARSGAFLAAAVRAGRATGPGIASVYDAAEEAPSPDSAASDGPRGPVSYIVAEWVDGRGLDVVLRDGPLPPARAAAVARALALALVGAHGAGVHAGRLHPGQVLLGPGGAVRVTDLEVAAALHGLPPAADPVRADTDAVARVLYAAVTGAWPVTWTGPDGRADPDGVLPDWDGLPPAAVHDGRLVLPRQIRAGVPKELDTVVAQVLDPLRRPGAPALRTPAALAAALAPLAAAAPERGHDGAGAATRDAFEDSYDGAGDDADYAELDDDRELRVPLWRRRWPRIAAAVIFLAIVGGAGWVTGEILGKVPRDPAAVAPRVPGQASASPGAVVDDPLPVDAFTFDPPPGDGKENESGVVDAYDEDAQTTWTTERYATADLGGIKGGVGLLVDLAQPQTIDRVVLDIPAGQAMQLFAAGPTVSARPTTLDTLTAVSPATEGAAQGETTLRPSAGTRARWWVLWITKLPTAAEPGPGGSFQAAITEFAFYPAR